MADDDPLRIESPARIRGQRAGWAKPEQVNEPKKERS